VSRWRSRLLTIVTVATVGSVLASCTTVGRDATPRQRQTPPVARNDGGSTTAARPTAAPPAPPEKGPESMPVPASSFNCPEVLVAARKGGSSPDRYVIPTAAERTDMSRLFAQFGIEATGALSTPAQRLGFELAALPSQPGVWSLVEAADKKRGGGGYLLRLPSASRLIVQAPHTFYDEGTLPLACELFERAEAQALFIETAHRYKAAEAGAAGNFPADLAHSEESLFQAATLGLLARRDGATIVQLHGFGPRESGADVVLSSGATETTPLVDAARRALSEVVGNVARFPQESRELGATTNVQGALARRHGANFLHVEMSAELRQRLLADAELRARFLQALLRGLATP